MELPVNGKRIDTSVMRGEIVQHENKMLKYSIVLPRFCNGIDLSTLTLQMRGTIKDTVAVQVMTAEIFGPSAEYVRLEWTVTALFTSRDGDMELEIWCCGQGTGAPVLKFYGSEPVHIRQSSDGSGDIPPELEEQITDNVLHIMGQAAAEAERARREADRSRNEADRSRNEADRSKNEADRSGREADRAGSEAGKLRGEIEAAADWLLQAKTKFRLLDIKPTLEQIEAAHPDREAGDLFGVGENPVLLYLWTGKEWIQGPPLDIAPGIYQAQEAHGYIVSGRTAAGRLRGLYVYGDTQVVKKDGAVQVSPDNPAEFTGVGESGEVPVYACGKNLWINRNAPSAAKGITIDYDSAVDEYVLNGESTDYLTLNMNGLPFIWEPGQIYSLSVRKVSGTLMGGNLAPHVVQYPYTPRWVVNTILTPEEEYVTTSVKAPNIQAASNSAVLAFWFPSAGIRCDQLRLKIQFEVGKVTEWERSIPYCGYAAAIPTPLYSLPDGAQDEMDVIHGKVRRRIGKVVLNGLEAWGIVNAPSAVETQTFQVFNLPVASVNLLCDRFPTQMNIEIGFKTDEECAYYSLKGKYLTLRIKKSRLAGWSDSSSQSEKIALMKNWLKANPTTVLYESIVPVVEDISPQIIETYEGKTTLLAPDLPVPTLSAVFGSVAETGLETRLEGKLDKDGTAVNALALGGVDASRYAVVEEREELILINGWKDTDRVGNPDNCTRIISRQGNWVTLNLQARAPASSTYNPACVLDEKFRMKGKNIYFPALTSEGVVYRASIDVFGQVFPVSAIPYETEICFHVTYYSPKTT